MKIILEKNAYLKLKYYVLGCEDEISGMGKSRYIDENTIRIKDIVIFKQDVSSGSTDLDKEELAKFLSKESKAGRDTSNWNVWWHSHAGMSTFWSGTDEETINSFLCDKYIIALETNHKLEFKARIDMFKPFRLTLNNIDVDIDIEEDPKLFRAITEEIKEKVSSGWSSKTEEEPKKETGGWGVKKEEQIEEPMTKEELEELNDLEEKMYLTGLSSIENNRYGTLTEKFYDTDYSDPDYVDDGQRFGFTEEELPLKNGKTFFTKIKGRSVRRKKRHLTQKHSSDSIYPHRVIG